MKSDLSFGLRKKIAESKQEQLEQAVLAAAKGTPRNC